MPVTSCGQTTVLTGQDGMVTMVPPGTTACLLDHTDFPAPTAPATASLIVVPATSDFRVDDPVVFTEKGTANLDSALTAGTVYYIKTRPAPGTVSVSATKGGAGIALTGDGGVSSADTPGNVNHIEMSYSADMAVCELAGVTLEVTRGEIDTTSIPCTPSSGAGKLAPFRTSQSGFASGSGTITVRLNSNNDSFTNRIVQGSLFLDQSGARLSAYFHAIAATGGTGAIDKAKSQYCEFPISLLGFSGGITTEDTATEISINYSVSGQPLSVFGLTP